METPALVKMPRINLIKKSEFLFMNGANNINMHIQISKQTIKESKPLLENSATIITNKPNEMKLVYFGPNYRPDNIDRSERIRKALEELSASCTKTLSLGLMNSPFKHSNMTLYVPDINPTIPHKKEIPVIIETFINFIKNNQNHPKTYQLNLVVEDTDYELYTKTFLEKFTNFYFSYPEGTRFMCTDGTISQRTNNGMQIVHLV